jgi:hypothetical protein
MLGTMETRQSRCTEKSDGYWLQYDPELRWDISQHIKFLGTLLVVILLMYSILIPANYSGVSSQNSNQYIRVSNKATWLAGNEKTNKGKNSLHNYCSITHNKFKYLVDKDWRCIYDTDNPTYNDQLTAFMIAHASFGPAQYASSSLSQSGMREHKELQVMLIYLAACKGKQKPISQPLFLLVAPYLSVGLPRIFETIKQRRNMDIEKRGTAFDFPKDFWSSYNRATENDAVTEKTTEYKLERACLAKGIRVYRYILRLSRKEFSEKHGISEAELILAENELLPIEGLRIILCRIDKLLSDAESNENCSKSEYAFSI